MENLEIQVQQELGNITTNFDEVEKELKLQMSAYENFVVVEDEISIAKGDLAFLRKLRTSIEDKRKAIKKEYLEPYNKFEESCKKLTAIIDAPINTIDEQLKLFEAERAEKKRERVTELYNEQVGEYIRFLPIEKYFNPKWLNKSTTDQDIAFEISEKLLKVKNDLNAIKSLNSEIEEDIISTYINSGNDLAKAIERNTQYLSDKAKVVEQVKEVEPKVEPTPTPQPVKEEVKPNTAKIVVSVDDLPQIKETLDFMGVKYEIEGV